MKSLSVLSSLSVVALAGALGCNKDRTEILIGLATDLSAPSPLHSVTMKITDANDGTPVGEPQTFPVSGRPGALYELPGTFAVFSASGSADRFRADLTATDDSGKTIVVRSAVMNLVPEKTLFVRLGTVSACEGMADTCGVGQTCTAGHCANEDVDSSLLPVYKPGIEGEVACADGTHFVDTSTGLPLQVTGVSCGAGTCLDGVCLAPAKSDAGADATGAGGSGAGGSHGADAGPDGGPRVDAGPDAAACTNSSDPTLLPIDPTGYVSSACDSFGIQGSWFCNADTTSSGTGNGSSSCANGVVPYDATAQGMCISGTTSTNSGATGAGIGLALNSVRGANAARSPYNAGAHGVVGFEVTIASLAGATNNVALRLTFTTVDPNTTTLPQPYVELPGPGTYDVLLADAVVPATVTGTSLGLLVNPASIYDVQLAIAPQGATAVPYGYCITKLKPITAAPTIPGSCGALQPYGNPVCGAQDFLGEVGSYGVQNNLTGTGQQCIQAMVGGTCAGFSLSYPTNSINGSSFPVAFPAIVYGWQDGSFYGAYKTARQIGNINRIPSTWTFGAPSTALWDASYEIWVGPTPTPLTANNGLAILVWLNAGGVSPGNSPFKTGQTLTQVPGTWNVYRGTINSNGSTWQYLTYLASPPQTSFNNVDLKQFINDAINEGVGISTTSYLLGVQAGFEVSGPNAGVVTSYSVSAQ